MVRMSQDRLTNAMQYAPQEGSVVGRPKRQRKDLFEAETSSVLNPVDEEEIDVQYWQSRIHPCLLPVLTLPERVAIEAKTPTRRPAT